MDEQRTYTSEDALIVDDVPRMIVENAPNFECPLCQMPMQIGGRYERGDTEGKAKVIQHVCHQCGKTVNPKKL